MHKERTEASTQEHQIESRARQQRPSRANGVPTVYNSMETYHRRRGGRNSPETDYGCRNTDDLGLVATIDENSVRVSLVEDTGDIYAINEDEHELSRVALLGQAADNDGRPMSEKIVNSIFQDWAQGPASRPLSWFIRQIHANRHHWENS